MVVKKASKMEANRHLKLSIQKVVQNATPKILGKVRTKELILAFALFGITFACLLSSFLVTAHDGGSAANLFNQEGIPGIHFGRLFHPRMDRKWSKRDC